jgi:ribosomal protein S18 acetylase RimI-like enzyme
MASIELAWRALGPDDLAAAQALSREAGWNQTADDWRQMIAMGEGLAVVVPDGAVAATGLTLPYGGRFGWIAMILVTAAQRRRGLATALLRRSMAVCAERGLVAGLDATEAGRLVYLPLGFKDIYPLSRMVADRPRGGTAAGVRPMTAADLPAVAAYDRTVFGADRANVLRHLLQRWPQAAWVAGEPVAGFCLGRDGRVARQIGPLSASDGATALSLLNAALAATPGPVLIDAADHQSGFRAALEAAGFARQRGYVRMLLDRSEPLDRPAGVYAISGPELG